MRQQIKCTQVKENIQHSNILNNNIIIMAERAEVTKGCFATCLHNFKIDYNLLQLNSKYLTQVKKGTTKCARLQDSL